MLGACRFCAAAPRLQAAAGFWYHVCMNNRYPDRRNAISDVNGIIAHCKDVVAQPAKHKGKNEPKAANPPAG